MNVDWSKLIACDGNASAQEVPKAIEMLLFGSPEERKQAYWKIDNYVVVQGGLFESAPYAARLLVEKINTNPDKLNIEVLDILFELANGSADSAFVEHGPLKGQPIQKLCRETIAEVLPVLSAAKASASEPEKKTIQDLLEKYEDTNE
jgi:hypothetical protein